LRQLSAGHRVGRKNTQQEPSLSPSDRVALVVVHGIADQRPRQTVREVARLLCRGGEGAPAYEQGEMVDVLVPVQKLDPGGRQQIGKTETARRKPGAPSGFYQAQQAESAGALESEVEAQDLGIKLNDYLLGQLALPEGDALYESTRVSLRRPADGREIDVYEMYWADLSRLGAGGLRALTSLYQVFFHLNTLAADVVDQVSLSINGGAGWRLLQRCQAYMAWLMKGPTALLQLALLLTVVFGATTLVHESLRPQLLAAAFAVGAVALAAFAGLAWLRIAPGGGRWIVTGVLVGAALASAALAFLALLEWGPVGSIYFAVAALGTALLGGYLIERYAGMTPGVRILGHLVLVSTIAAVCIVGIVIRPHFIALQEWMVTAALNVAEWLLAGVLLSFAAFVLVQVGAIVLGLWLGRGCDQAARASLHTARLFLITSSGLFAVLSLVLWSVVSFVTQPALKDIYYSPLVFGRGYPSAANFLEERVKDLGSFFTPLVLGIALVVAAVLVVLLPCLLEEIKPSRQSAGWAARLGRWLSGGVRVLGSAFKVLLPLGAVAGSLLYLAFVLQPFAHTAWLSDVLELMQRDTLVAAGKWLAGGALTIAALGARFTKTFGRLRVAIDAVLDVDNYFADPPNRMPPRARIYSRYASLLAWLREAGYARLVIVSHSQGTVISADLLRYLNAQGRLQDVVGTMPLALVTVGSPLRNLYAERFPLLYRWMGPASAGPASAGLTAFAAAGPAAKDLGATEWVNAYRSGDYIGRFIWGSDNFELAAVDANGRLQARRAGDRTEFCLGAGAHTHYFSDDAIALAAEIERLVAGKPSS
jgi:hypothetical protein